MTNENMIRCKKCGYYFSADTKVCPECGAIIISGGFAMVKYIVLVLSALLILFLIGYDKKVEPVEILEPNYFINNGRINILPQVLLLLLSFFHHISF